MGLFFLLAQCLQDPTLGTRIEAGWIWIFHYVNSAYRHPRVFKALRWFTGSFLVAIRSTVKFQYIHRPSHVLSRKFLLQYTSNCSTGVLLI